jgi:hypothetical protein
MARHVMKSKSITPHPRRAPREALGDTAPLAVPLRVWSGIGVDYGWIGNVNHPQFKENHTNDGNQGSEPEKTRVNFRPCFRLGVKAKTQRAGELNLIHWHQSQASGSRDTSFVRGNPSLTPPQSALPKGDHPVSLQPMGIASWMVDGGCHWEPAFTPPDPRFNPTC